MGFVVLPANLKRLAIFVEELALAVEFAIPKSTLVSSPGD